MKKRGDRRDERTWWAKLTQAKPFSLMTANENKALLLVAALFLFGLLVRWFRLSVF